MDRGSERRVFADLLLEVPVARSEGRYNLPETALCWRGVEDAEDPFGKQGAGLTIGDQVEKAIDAESHSIPIPGRCVSAIRDTGRRLHNFGLRGLGERTENDFNLAAMGGDVAVGPRELVVGEGKILYPSRYEEQID
jgi:hypothetical protein